MSPLRMIYLGLAVWGAVQPIYDFAFWMQANGLDYRGMIAAWQANATGIGLFQGIFIASVALAVFVVAEVAVRRNWIGLIVIPVTFLVGVGCGLPLYLFLRTRPVV